MGWSVDRRAGMITAMTPAAYPFRPHPCRRHGRRVRAGRQSQKTAAHLTGAAVPSEERRNSGRAGPLLHTVFLHTYPTRFQRTSRGLSQGVDMDTPSLATEPLPPRAAPARPHSAVSGFRLSPHSATASVDQDALRRLVRHYRDAGVHGLVACGSTGEAAALDAGEQLLVLDTILTEAGGLPVAMGLSGNHLGQARDRIRQFAERPLAGVLASAPAYVRPAQDGLRLWFEALADASRVPLVLYDIPYRTGATLETATLLALAAHPNIVAIKDCGGSLDKTIALLADGGLAVMAGEDLQALATLSLGGAGAIVASAHVRPDLHVAMFEAARERQVGSRARPVPWPGAGHPPAVCASQPGARSRRCWRPCTVARTCCVRP